jgi:hypothetical protein
MPLRYIGPTRQSIGRAVPAAFEARTTALNHKPDTLAKHAKYAKYAKYTKYTKRTPEHYPLACLASWREISWCFLNQV